MLLLLKSSTQQIKWPAVYCSRKHNLNFQPEAEANKIHTINEWIFEFLTTHTAHKNRATNKAESPYNQF